MIVKLLRLGLQLHTYIPPSAFFFTSVGLVWFDDYKSMRVEEDQERYFKL